MDHETTTTPAPAARRRNSPSSSSTPPDSAGAWQTSLDAGGEAPPAVDSAALAQVLQETEAPAPGKPSAPGSAPAPAPSSANEAPAPSSGPVSGPVSDPDRWSNRKLERAKPKELRARIRELEARVPAPTPAGEPAPMPQATPDEKLGMLRAALGPSFKMAGGLLARMFGSKHLEITDPESEKLAAAWAPICLPHWDAITEYAPWAVALGATYEIGEPKVTAAMAERNASRRKLAGADPVTAAVDDAPGE